MLNDEDIILAYREQEKKIENGSHPVEMIDPRDNRTDKWNNPWDDRMEKWRQPDDVLNYRHERITK